MRVTFRCLTRCAAFGAMTSVSGDIRSRVTIRCYRLARSRETVIFGLTSRDLRRPKMYRLGTDAVTTSLRVDAGAICQSVGGLRRLNVVRGMPDAGLGKVGKTDVCHVLPCIPSDISRQRAISRSDGSTIYPPRSRGRTSGSFGLLDSGRTGGVVDLNGRLTLRTRGGGRCVGRCRIVLCSLVRSLPLGSRLGSRLRGYVLTAGVGSVHSFIGTGSILTGVVHSVTGNALAITDALETIFMKTFGGTVRHSGIGPCGSSFVRRAPIGRHPIPFCG